MFRKIQCCDSDFICSAKFTVDTDSERLSVVIQVLYDLLIFCFCLFAVHVVFIFFDLKGVSTEFNL